MAQIKFTGQLEIKVEVFGKVLYHHVDPINIDQQVANLNERIPLVKGFGIDINESEGTVKVGFDFDGLAWTVGAFKLGETIKVNHSFWGDKLTGELTVTA